MHARIRGQKAYYLFIKLQIKPDFPSLADEIAEQRPDMNVKVADTVTVDRYILMQHQLPFISFKIQLKVNCLCFDDVTTSWHLQAALT